MTESRDRLLRVLERDLLGPQGGDAEVIRARPRDQYLTGMLHPIVEDADPEDDDDRDTADSDEGPGAALPMNSIRRPNVMGISFAVAATGQDGRLEVRGGAGRYRRRWQSSDGLVDQDAGVGTERWCREQVPLELDAPLSAGLEPYSAGDGLRWWVRCSPGNESTLVTIVLANERRVESDRVDQEQATLFQVGFSVRTTGDARFVPRRPTSRANDDDTESNDLIYRDVSEYAVGHTCSADWIAGDGCIELHATWMPRQLVRSMTPAGHAVFARCAQDLSSDVDLPFRASALAAAPTPEELVRLLDVVPRAYSLWLRDVTDRVTRLAEDGELARGLAQRAKQHIENARGVADRMRAGVALLAEDETARAAFQLAQEAMAVQRRWAKGEGADLVWRPFQLAFQLLTLVGIANPKTADGSVHVDRRTMDLLWFPTGGGKTEAYLAIVAFTIMQRRLRRPERPDDGAGTAVLMRYTLRLLTVQQFERATRLVLACEHLRRRDASAGRARLGTVPFSVGLWVGGGATPNRRDDARSAEGRRRAAQLAACPVCNGNTLLWDRDPQGPRFEVVCTASNCPSKTPDDSALPIWTIDDEIYRERPSLVIGTIDKFAQIVRDERTAALFGSASVPPPDLIIQDELHLISGPLGTVAGIYEIAIDRLCSAHGVPPKVIGSTATIRRAREQVRQLFDREVLQFPPPVLDAEDSCFTVVDRGVPGRLYAGVTTAGRSPKFVLQAVCASLMQAASEPFLSNAERDPYWTLVAYFNSLRELGGALVMMQDDVLDSMGVYATLHGTNKRSCDDEPCELTSRVDQTEIPSILKSLAQSYPSQTIATVLATNMISVGVDIERLGLMVVNGQPKSMAEYIQATSRVGRQSVPGLVVTVYNAGRPRDRSHYEAFRTWHQALYRDVEATSVTPYAPRARDRALHAAVAAIARHTISGMIDDPVLSNVRRSQLELEIDAIVARAERADPDEVDGVRTDATNLLDWWQRRGALENWWHERKPNKSLLIGAEEVARQNALDSAWSGAARGTPNSMRDVEPGVDFRLTTRLAARRDFSG